MTSRPATYVRQSSARVNKSEASPETQRAGTRERALHEHPAATLLTFEDIDRSGYKPGVVRDDYDRLLAAARLGEVTHLYVYYVSRLTRQDPKVALAEWLPLIAAGLTIVSVTEGTFGPDNTMDLIHLLLRLDAAHNESKNKSMAVKGAKALARAAGGHVGYAPYGFGTSEEIRQTPEGRPVAVRALVVEPAEARVLRIAARAVTWGVPVHRVAAYLDGRGYATRGATVGRARAKSLWTGRSLGQRLRDPRIAGLPAVLGKHGNVDCYRVATGLVSERLLPAPDEAIIAPEEFWRVQAQLERRARAPQAGDTPALLSSLGILFCECGAMMKSRRFIATAALANRNAYMCPSRTHSCTISMTSLDRHVRDVIVRKVLADDPINAAPFVAEVFRRFRATRDDPAAAAQRSALAAELTDAQASLDAQAAAAAALTGAAQRAVQATLGALGQRVDDLAERLADIDSRRVGDALPLTWWVDVAQEVAEWDGFEDRPPMSMLARRDRVKLFIDRITVSRAASKGGRTINMAARVAIKWARLPQDE